jgi:hypothetical protein
MLMIISSDTMAIRRLLAPENKYVHDTRYTRSYQLFYKDQGEQEQQEFEGSKAK